MHHHLSGLIAAAYTPMHSDGSLNLEVIPQMVDFLVKSGVSGIYLCGSTGEGMSLSSEERRRVTAAYVVASSGRLTTIVHVGHNSLVEAHSLAQHAEAIGADAVSATAPSYYSIDSTEILVDCMAEVASGAPNLPFYYYHIPAKTGACIDMSRFLELGESRIPTLVGIKYTAPLIHEFQACRDLMKNKWDIVWGTDEMLLSALAVGANSAIGSTYSLAAPLYLHLIEAFKLGNLKRAQELQSLSIRLISILAKYPFHAAAKAILSEYGIQCGPCRRPLESLGHAETLSLKNDLASSGFADLLERWSCGREMDGDHNTNAHTGIPAPHIVAGIGAESQKTK